MKTLNKLTQTLRKIIVEKQLLIPHYRLLEKLNPVMFKFPKDKKKALILTYDVETFSSINKNKSEIEEEYEGFMPRVLDVLDSYHINVQFFICGRSIELYSGLISSIIQKGHNIGGHGYMHEKMYTLSYKSQRELIRKVQEISKDYLKTEMISWRFPFLTSNFGGYKALGESGFKLSSSTMEVNRPVRIRGIVEVPLIAMDGDIIGYSLPRSKVGVWVDFMKNSLAKLDKGILIFGMHTWLQMKADPELEGLQEFLLGIEPFREEIWVGTLDEYYNHYISNLKC